MALFNMRVHHGGLFGYENGVLKYLKGQSTVVEDIDGDRWSVFEAYEELRQLGYLKSNISTLWYKDPTEDDYERHLKLLGGDTEAIEMCTIAGRRGFVDLFVVHKVEDAEGFPEVGFLDVGGETVGGQNEKPLGGGMDLVVFEGNVDNSDGARVAGQQECQNKDGGVELGQEGHEAVSDDVSSGEDSDDPTYLPSDEEENSVEDIHFTDSDKVYDYESGFGEDNAVPNEGNVEKDKKVVTSDLDDEDAVDSDELEQDHVIGIDADDGEDHAEEGGRVAAYAVNTARNIKFKKCDLVRVRAVCQKGCPFWLYAHRVVEESTWQLRSMNLQHTCMQTHRVGIMHSKWLGSQFKKKVESNPKIKVKELVAKAHKKWNLTGLLPAFEEVIPGVDNRFCVRHLYSNFRKKFSSLELKNKMWRCAKASHWQSWEKEMKNLRVLNEGAFRHLNGIPPRFWSRSRFTFLSKCDSLVNNMSESFNAVLVEAREKPIEVIHPVNGPELWKRTQYDDVIPPPYRRPSHRPMKKRKRGAADEDNRSQTHLSRRGEVQRCSNCGGVGHKKSGCSQPKKRAQSSTKRAKKNAPKLAPGQTAWGGRKRNTAPSPTNLSTSHTRKTPTRPKKHEARPTTEAPQPKKASTKPKKASTQPNILAQTKNKAASSATSTSNKQPPSQPSVRKRPFSVIQCSAPHLPLQKLRLMAKLLPSQWGNL
ncbi:hypothetical protein Ahy_B08g092336 [Arachis hypogaea]|uniref:PB1-like domain-containing protein n=1 Tax=Arachis hypogaea TaxID=3818 RepID=A0A444Y3R3_ARAHY|nr:hypothetical protein Ahy_B08g092336 [Arachis hypogaea]